MECKQTYRRGGDLPVGQDSTSEAFSWMQHHNGAGTTVLLSLLLLVCILTWLDPLVRSDRTTAGIAVCGWVFMCAIGTWRAAFVRNPSGVLAWAVAGLYALVIIATLGRPLLMLSDLLEEKEEDEGIRYSEALWRRSRIAQAVVLTGIGGGLFVVYFL
jgi:hypothetical protein